MGDDQAIQGVIETIDTAINYRFQLSLLLDSLHEAKNQVNSSAAQSRTKLRAHFECLRQCVIEALDERLATLERVVDDAELSAMEPLDSCELILKERVNVAVSIMEKGKQFLVNEDEQQCVPGDTESMTDFRRHTKDLDLNSLPEVPSLSETAFIHVDLPRDEENIQRQLVDAIHEYGRVLTHVPVQIVDISERPAALLIKWAESVQSEDHVAMDLDEFRLQFCLGAVSNPDPGDDGQFTDVYVGTNSSYVVRQLVPKEKYTFRVCGRAEGATTWSPWSVPIVWSTTLHRHEWRSETPGYILSNNNATIRFGEDSSQIAFSQTASYVCGHAITFCVGDFGDSAPEVDDGVGLTLVDNSNIDSQLRSKGFLFYSFQGSVFVDGQEKTTRLPAITPGSSIIFDTELLPSEKVRVTIEVSEKIITFDWPLPLRPTQSSASSLSTFGAGCAKEDKNQTSLFFAARLSSASWSVTVE